MKSHTKTNEVILEQYLINSLLSLVLGVKYAVKGFLLRHLTTIVFFSAMAFVFAFIFGLFYFGTYRQ